MMVNRATCDFVIPTLVAAKDWGKALTLTKQCHCL